MVKTDYTYQTVVKAEHYNRPPIRPIFFQQKKKICFPSCPDRLLQFFFFVLNVLEVLKQASHVLQSHRSSNLTDFNSSPIKALLELQTESDTILSKDPNLSIHSINVLCGLIKSIKSPLVDEIESNGEIPKVINLLDVKDLQMRVTAMDCVLEIGYFGRKEAIEAMLKQGLVKKLVELQRSELGGDWIEMERFDEKDEKWERIRQSKQRRFLEMHPFASSVVRFAVQLEVGEGLRQREKRAFKQEILVTVKEELVSDAEATTIIVEVLWGSSP